MTESAKSESWLGHYGPADIITFNVTLDFPDICAGCHQPLDGECVGQVIAGPATLFSHPELVAGAEMFTTRQYHNRCFPADQ